MSLTYGYDLKEDDDILVPVRKTSEIMIQVVLPGAALVNHLPFRTERSFLLPLANVCDNHFSQYDTPHSGFHCSSMSPWLVYAGN
jgi:hypothetical protein